MWGCMQGDRNIPYLEWNEGLSWDRHLGLPQKPDTTGDSMLSAERCDW
jgi:hypothetical protein